MIEADAVAATGAVAAAGEASLAWAVEKHRGREADGAGQEAAGHGRKTRRGRRKRRHGNCIEGPCAAMRVRIVLVEGRRIAQQN
ncbi:MAG: hypothetical protein F4169_04890 [Gammaproteobacteria bacterium]|nr:hypothetical protein [Gammaproteobacteria bacterium]